MALIDNSYRVAFKLLDDAASGIEKKPVVANLWLCLWVRHQNDLTAMRELETVHILFSGISQWPRGLKLNRPYQFHTFQSWGAHFAVSYGGEAVEVQNRYPVKLAMCRLTSLTIFLRQYTYFYLFLNNVSNSS